MYYMHAYKWSRKQNELVKTNRSLWPIDVIIGNNNIRLMYDVINYCNENNLHGLLLCTYFEKKLSIHSTGIVCTKCLNLIRWINVFYHNIKSTVLVNGQTSEWFPVKRCCRQGDPTSPYLFILCAEILAIMIKENKDIRGIVLVLSLQ